MITIKKLGEERWAEYRELRLEGLKSDSIAFGSAYEEENEMSEEDWKLRMKNALFALSGDRLVGMIVVVNNERIKASHIANIFGVYVRKEYRGQKIGKKLMEAALKTTQKNQNFVKVSLTVNPEQTAAVNLYKSFGFELVGRLKKELKVDNIFYDEVIMEKFLS